MNGPATVFIDNLLLNPEKYLKGKKVAVLQFGLNILLSVQWHNIAKIDKEMKLFSSSKLVETFKFNGTARQTMALIPGGIEVKTETEPFELVSFSPDKIDNNKDFVVVIPACLLSGNVQIVVNSIEHSLPSSWERKQSSYQSLLFELPAGTTEINVSVKGYPNSYFMLKDIQIWQ